MLFVWLNLSESEVQINMLRVRNKEALALNFAFQLHQMPDKSTSASNNCDWLIQMVRRSNPNVVTVRVLRFEKSFSLNFVSLYSKKREGHWFLGAIIVKIYKF